MIGDNPSEKSKSVASFGVTDVSFTGRTSHLKIEFVSILAQLYIFENVEHDGTFRWLWL